MLTHLLPAPRQIFYSFFKTLEGKEVIVELKNDLELKGTLHSVDRFLNVKLNDITVVNADRHPQLVCSPRAARKPTPSAAVPHAHVPTRPGKALCLGSAACLPRRLPHPPSAPARACCPRPQLSVKNCFIRGSVVRYVQIPAKEVDTELLQVGTCRAASAAAWPAACGDVLHAIPAAFRPRHTPLLLVLRRVCAGRRSARAREAVSREKW